MSICKLALLRALCAALCTVLITVAGGASAAPPVLTTYTLKSGGLQRSYLMHVPESYKAGRDIPLVIVLHGSGGSGTSIATMTGYASLADNENFIAVFPNATNGTTTITTEGGNWDAGNGRGFANDPYTIDDLGFITSMLSQIRGQYSIDPRRIYVTGLSRGGTFSYYIACNLADQIAAIAVVAGTMSIHVQNDCTPDYRIPVYHIHGTADTVLPWLGGKSLLRGDNDSRPIPDVLDFWRSADKCSATTSRAKEAPDTTCYSYQSCTREVKYCLVSGGGHAWPGALYVTVWQIEHGVFVAKDFDATAKSWEWFKAHPKP